MYMHNMWSGEDWYALFHHLRYEFVCHWLMCDHVSLHVSNVVYTICIARMYSKPTKAHDNNKPEAGGGGGIESVFALDKWCYPLKISPSLIVYSVANYRPYPSHFWANVTLNPIVTIENATPFQSIQTWKCNLIRRQIPNSLLLGSKRHSKYTEDNNKYLWAI